MSSLTFQHPLPLSLYIHFPWCIQKCPYCDFNSHAVRGEIPQQSYVDALIADLQMERKGIDGRVIQSIFIGGGTPSLMSGGEFKRLMSAVSEICELASDAEITLEANPGTVDERHFSDYRDAGANRLSIGVQSFNNAALKRLGRIHDQQTAIRAFHVARQSGFENINLDLMYGLPSQDAKLAETDVAQAIDLKPEHISHYQLTLEPNTPFHHAPPALPDDELIIEMLDNCQHQLNNAGYQHYEISAYAQQGKRARHNLNYWQFGDYLGIGAGAHGKITDSKLGKIERRWKSRHPKHYLGSADKRLAGQQRLAPEDIIAEFMMNALRLKQGVSWDIYDQHTGLPREDILKLLPAATDKELLIVTDEGFYPSELGFQFLNELIALFIPDSA